MKTFVKLLIFIFISISGTAQVYTSPVTHYLPGYEAEWIDRTITFTNDTVFIRTKTFEGFTTQRFVVNQIAEEVLPDSLARKFYICSSMDNIYFTYFQLPISETVPFIEVVQPRQYLRDANHYIFIVD